MQKRIVATTAVRNAWLAALLALCFLSGGCVTTRTKVPADVHIVSDGAWRGGLQFDHVLIIVLENQSYKDALADPYLRELAEKGVSFKNFFGLYHPSYPNYISMI